MLFQPELELLSGRRLGHPRYVTHGPWTTSGRAPPTKTSASGKLKAWLNFRRSAATSCGRRSSAARSSCSWTHSRRCVRALAPAGRDQPPARVGRRPRPRESPDRDAEIVVYCASTTCDSSVQVGERLIELGYPNVHHYVEGKKGWIEAGLPVEGGGVRVSNRAAPADTRAPRGRADGRCPTAAGGASSGCSRCASPPPRR